MHQQTMMQVINRYWAQKLNCDEVQIASPGISIVPKIDKTRLNSDSIFIFKGRFASVLKVPEFYIGFVIPAVNNIPKLVGVSGKRLMALIRSEHLSVNLQSIFYDYYLPLSNFRVHHPDNNFVIRRLSVEDRGSLNALFCECRPEEVEIADISLNDPAVFGCYNAKGLVSVASSLLINEAIADVKFLTHPANRGKGLGKSVLSALCEWGMDQGYIMRFHGCPGNSSAAGLVRGIGFMKYHTLENLEVSWV
ncbi:MAG: hypothetical protein MUO76_16120 [Anaerolineaceae bacterium]|nr:hypothetical protein [Anaerolineaceae bacterium]